MSVCLSSDICEIFFLFIVLNALFGVEWLTGEARKGRARGRGIKFKYDIYIIIIM